MREELRVPTAGWPPAHASVLCFVVRLLRVVLITDVRIAHPLSEASLTRGSVDRGQVPSHLCPSGLQACTSWLERTLCQEVQGRDRGGPGLRYSIVWASPSTFVRLEVLHGYDFIRLLNALGLEMFPGNTNLFGLILVVNK